MSKKNQPFPPGHVLLPAAAIGSLSLLLAVGLGLLGLLARMNLLAANLVLHGKPATFPKSLPPWLLWLVVAVFAFGLPITLLVVPSTWRRVVLWIFTLVLIAGWAPVLSLAARTPEIAAPFIVAVWSGVCALVYAANHRMACDFKPDSPTT